MSHLDDAAKEYAQRFSDRERAVRVVAFTAGGKWAMSDDNPAMRYPDALPRTNRTRCTYLTPCPTRPTYFLGRFITRPWRCPECSRWWVTGRDQTGSFGWIRAEPFE